MTKRDKEDINIRTIKSDTYFKLYHNEFRYKTKEFLKFIKR